MHVKVKLYATLVRYGDGIQAGKPIDLELHAGATLRELIEALKIPLEATRVMFVNGIIQEADCALNEGDEVGIFPPIGGG